MNNDSNSSSNNNDSPIEFYDIIISIDSILSLKKGWEVKYTEKGYETYLKYKDVASTVVGIIGNGNKGKSFLLQRISDCPLISGYSVKTEGLSLVYPRNMEKNIICLDTAGLDTPILETDEYKLSRKSTKKEILEMISTISRDKQLTELFLQTFVLQYSDILIAVVGQLTNSDQKLLNRIKKDCKNKKNKQLLIVHNLITLTTKKEVEDYIEETLMTSMTFKLHSNSFIDLENQGKKEGSSEQNMIYYVEEELMNNEKEKEDSNNSNNIVHFVIALEGSEAGNYYNQVVYNFLKQKCQTHAAKRPFQVLDKVKNHLIATSSNMMEDPINEEKELEINERYIKMASSKNITLKKCLVNELGYSNFSGKSFVPKYSHYIDTAKNQFVITFEISGEVPPPKITVTTLSENQIFKINGFKPSRELISKSGMTTKESGNYEIDIRVPISKVPLESTKTQIVEKKDGIIRFYFQLQKANTEEEQEIDFEEQKSE